MWIQFFQPAPNIFSLRFQGPLPPGFGNVDSCVQPPRITRELVRDYAMTTYQTEIEGFLWSDK